MTILVFLVYFAVLVSVMALFDALVYGEPYITELSRILLTYENKLTILFSVIGGLLWGALSIYYSRKRTKRAWQR